MMDARQFDRTGRHAKASSKKPELSWDLASTQVTRLKQITIDRYELTYAERGTGEPVLFVHGALSDYRTWIPQLDSFSRRYHAVSYSRRYHQPNAPKTAVADYTYRKHVDDLIALMDSLELKSSHLVGHSYGGAVAMLATLERPDLVGSLVLAEPSLFSLLNKPEDKVSLRFHRIAMDVVQKLAENNERKLAVREYVNIVLGRDGYDELPLEVVLVIVQNAHTLGPMLGMFFDLDFDSEHLRNLKTPVLIVTGESSPRVYRAVSHALHQSLPHSELLTLAGASHGLHMENPRDFNDAVLDFLSKGKPTAPLAPHRANK